MHTRIRHSMIIAALALLGCGGGGQQQEARCGDGVVQPGEACDGADLAGERCVDLGMGFVGGTLACGSSCQFVTTGCQPPPTVCGDGTAQAGEACDGTDLRGLSCVDLGFAGGTLACGAGCAPDTSGCLPLGPRCGDGLAQAAEACDGADLAGQTCVGLGFAGGSLTCDASCGLVTTGCIPSSSTCGDGVVDPHETCDDGGTQGGDGCSATCQLEGGSSGWLAPGGGVGEAGSP